MKQLTNYIQEILGVDIQISPMTKERLSKLPMYIIDYYTFYETVLFNQPLLIAEYMPTDAFSIMQTQKHFEILGNTIQKKIVFVLKELTSINRKRLIEKGINFIVPGKQLFLPDMLMDLRESFTAARAKKENEKLSPSAQFILIYHLLHRNINIEKYSFKQLAQQLNYTQMAISKAIECLKTNDVITVEDGKQKFIRFNLQGVELWNDGYQRKLFTNPVLKKVYVDELPKGLFLLHSNESALPEYSDMNPSRQEYFAIEKNTFYDLQKNNSLLNANENEGKYCLEVWKYNPKTLVGELPNDNAVVDPLSLYLTLAERHDERIEMTLEQIIEKFITN